MTGRVAQRDVAAILQAICGGSEGERHPANHLAARVMCVDSSQYTRSVKIPGLGRVVRFGQGIRKRGCLHAPYRVLAGENYPICK